MKNFLLRTFLLFISFHKLSRRLVHKIFFLLAGVTLSLTSVVGQPVISSFAPLSAPAGATVTITGNNFSTVPSSNSVFFGPVKAVVTSASSTSLSVLVPASATYDYITVSTTTGTAYSKNFFTIIQGVPLDALSFNKRLGYKASGGALTGIATGDFDGDGKPEMISANWSTRNISVYRNTSVAGSISFAPDQIIATGAKPDMIGVGDINHDGKLDMAVPSADDHLICVLINNSTIGNLSFTRQDIFSSITSYPRSLAMSDVDGDGLIDLVLADDNDFFGAPPGGVSIFRNTSTGTTLSFAAPKIISNLPQNFSVSMNDLDGDGRTDLVVGRADITMSVLKNLSTPGNISFGPMVNYTTGTFYQGALHLTVGDLDGDGKADVCLTQGAAIAVFRNTSVTGTISFAPRVDLSSTYSYGLTMGDLDGDAKPELVAAGFISGPVVFRNNSTPGNISFGPYLVYTSASGEDSYDVCIVDVDGDGYPNLALTINNTNMVEILYPAAPHPVLNLGKDTTLCEGDSLIITANIPNAGYQWNNGSQTRTIVVKQPGKYWLDVTTMTYSTSDTINIAFRPKPVLSLGPDRQMCSGDTAVIHAGISGAQYLWQNGSILDSMIANQSGDYWLEADQNGCKNRDTVNISMKPLPIVNIGKDTVICQKDTLVLDATSQSIAGYLWQNGNAQSKINIYNPGTYWVKVKGTNGCFNVDTINVKVNAVPDFTLGPDTLMCSGNVLGYQFHLNNVSYLWSNSSQSSSFNIVQPGLYWLRVDQNGCSKTDTVSVGIKPLPTVSLGNDTTLCENNDLVLNALNTGANYTWSTGASLPALVVHQTGNYWVHVDLDGCIATDTISVYYHELPHFTLGKDFTVCNDQPFVIDPKIKEGNFLWQDGSNGFTFSGSGPGRYSLTVTNECGSTSDSVLVMKGLCSLLMPTGFTPNGDGINDKFGVKYPQFIKTFSMKLYNRWGEVVFATSDPYEGWDGSFKGKGQPVGNYIWVISLVDQNGSERSYHGSVLLIR